MSQRSVLVLFLLLAASGTTSAQDFCGDIVDLQKSGTPTLVRLCVSGKKTRIEFQQAGNDSALISGLPDFPGQKERLVVHINGAGKTVILDIAGEKIVFLDAQNKVYDDTERWGFVAPNALYTLYTKHGSDPEDACAAILKHEAEGSTCTKTGYESVDGRRAVRYEVSASGQKIILWLDVTLHILVKRKSDWTSTELRNVREGTPPPSLFETPKDYAPGQLIQGGVVGKAEPE